MPNTYTMYDGKRITMAADPVGVADGAPDWAKQQWNITLRNGRKRMTFPYYGGGAASDPTADGVIESLTDGFVALDAPSFDDWADHYGYDPDSRSAEQIYRACCKLGARFARFLA